MLLMFMGASCGEKVNINYRTFSDAAALRSYMTWRPDRLPLISAHRGGPMGGFPENAIETFENVLRYGPCFIECDVRISKDGHLIMMHDTTLERTTNGAGKVSDRTLAELRKLFLRDSQKQLTAYRMPTFAEVLRWAKGRAVLTVDVKREVPFQRVIDEVRENKAEGHAIIITYNHDDMKKVYALAPDLMISGTARGLKGAEAMLAAGMPPGNICAFVGVSEPDPAVYELLHGKGIMTILGTMHNLDKRAEVRGAKIYAQLYRNGADILATDNVPLVAEAITGVIAGLQNP